MVSAEDGEIYDFSDDDHRKLSEGHPICSSPAPELIRVIECELHAGETLHYLICESDVEDDRTKESAEDYLQRVRGQQEVR